MNNITPDGVVCKRVLCHNSLDMGCKRLYLDFVTW
jgi:hypothetical protein